MSLEVGVVRQGTCIGMYVLVTYPTLLTRILSILTYMPYIASLIQLSNYRASLEDISLVCRREAYGVWEIGVVEIGWIGR